MIQTITHAVNALLDGIHGTHSVVYTQSQQQGLQQMIHSCLTNPEVDHITGQQEVRLAIEGGPWMGGINGSTIGRQACIHGMLGVVGIIFRGSNRAPAPGSRSTQVLAVRSSATGGAASTAWASSIVTSSTRGAWL
jgi:outer membrane lipoprotein SlyB